MGRRLIVLFAVARGMKGPAMLLRLILCLLLPSLATASPCDSLQAAICPTGPDAECRAFMDSKLVGPDGKPLSHVNRLLACKLAADDPESRRLYNSEFAALLTTAVFPITVRAWAKKLDGTYWDGLDTAPDIGACIRVDGTFVRCLPSGASSAAVYPAQCPDSSACTFMIQTHRGATVQVEVIDVDGMGGNELIGICSFTTGEDSAQCVGALDATVPYVRPSDAGAIVDRRVLGHWLVAPHGTGNPLPAAAIEFHADGRLVVNPEGARRLARYKLTSIDGALIKGEWSLTSDSLVPFTIEVLRDDALLIQQAGMTSMLMAH